MGTVVVVVGVVVVEVEVVVLVHQDRHRAVAGGLPGPAHPLGQPRTALAHVLEVHPGVRAGEVDGPARVVGEVARGFEVVQRRADPAADAACSLWVEKITVPLRSA